MNDENVSKPASMKAELWRQHLHCIDMMNQQVDENTASYLARFKEGTGQGRESIDNQPEARPLDEPFRVPFWITEK